MRIKLVIVCTLLVLGAFAESEEDKDRATLQQIREDPFGKSIIDTLELKMQTNGNAEFLLDFLYSVEKNFQAEQKEDDAAIKDTRLQCEKDEQRGKTEVAALEQNIQELDDILNEKGPVRDEKETLLQDKKSQEAQITERVNELDAAKAEKDDEWRTVAAEHDKATYIVESARQLMQNGIPTASFLQKSTDNQKKHKKHHNKNIAVTDLPQTKFTQLSVHINSNLVDQPFSKKSWNHTFKTLAEISNKLQDSRESDEQVLQLFRILQDKIADSRELARKEHDGWVQEYEETKAREVKKLTDVQYDIGQLQNEVSKLNKIIRENSNDKEDKEKTLRLKQTELKDQVRYCDTESDGYDKRRTTRRSNSNLTGDVIVIVNTNWRMLKQELNQ